MASSPGAQQSAGEDVVPKAEQTLSLLARNGSGNELKAALKRRLRFRSVDRIRVDREAARQLRSLDRRLFDHYGSKDFDRNTLLHVACCNGNVNTTKALLELGASPGKFTRLVDCLNGEPFGFCATGLEMISTGYEAPIHLAAAADSGPVIDLLLKTPKGASMVDAPSRYLFTPLMHATARYESPRGRIAGE